MHELDIVVFKHLEPGSQAGLASKIETIELRPKACVCPVESEIGHCSAQAIATSSWLTTDIPFPLQKR